MIPINGLNNVQWLHRIFQINWSIDIKLEFFFLSAFGIIMCDNLYLILQIWFVLWPKQKCWGNLWFFWTYLLLLNPKKYIIESQKDHQICVLFLLFFFKRNNNKNKPLLGNFNSSEYYDDYLYFTTDMPNNSSPQETILISANGWSEANTNSTEMPSDMVFNDGHRLSIAVYR